MEVQALRDSRLQAVESFRWRPCEIDTHASRTGDGPGRSLARVAADRRFDGGLSMHPFRIVRAAWQEECQDRDCECTLDHHQPHV